MRIRTIKPEFFMHDGLHDLEKESALPVRIAFVGLWCAADREGRFRWEPRRLKAQILPYDECDFSRVLDALSTRGFLVKYRVRDAWFGAIPTWKKHQIINNKERASELPQMPPTEDLDALTTRDERVHHACLKEGKGREGEGNTIAPAEAVAEGKPWDLIFEALCSVTGTDARSLTKSGHAALNAALRDIRAASPDVTRDEVKRRAGRYSRKFPTAALTAPALAKHWAACATPPADDWTRQQIKNATKTEPLQPADILADLPDVKRQFGIA